MQTNAEQKNNVDISLKNVSAAKQDAGTYEEHALAVITATPERIKDDKRMKRKKTRKEKQDNEHDKQLKRQEDENYKQTQIIKNLRRKIEDLQKLVDLPNKNKGQFDPASTEVEVAKAKQTTKNADGEEVQSTAKSKQKNKNVETVTRSETNVVRNTDISSINNHCTSADTGNEPGNETEGESKVNNIEGRVSRTGQQITPRNKKQNQTNVTNVSPTFCRLTTTHSERENVGGTKHGINYTTYIKGTGEPNVNRQLPTSQLLGFTCEKADSEDVRPAYKNNSDLTGGLKSNLPKLQIAQEAVNDKVVFREEEINTNININACENKHYSRDKYNNDSDENHTNLDYENENFIDEEVKNDDLIHASVNVLESLIMECLHKDILKANVDINHLNQMFFMQQQTFYMQQQYHKHYNTYWRQINEMERDLKTTMDTSHNEGKLTEDKLNAIQRDRGKGIPLITESTFSSGTYGNDMPSIIPSFQHISLTEAIRRKNPNWKNTSNYPEHDYESFPEPLSEINECLVKLDPTVLTGLMYMSTAERQALHKKITAANRRDFIPKNIWKALESVFALDFLDAIKKELDAISKLGVFEYVKVPANKQKEVISSRIIFDIKWDDTLKRIAKFKARLICGGHLQREWNEATGRGSYDPKGCSSPVVKSSSLKAQLATAGAVKGSEMCVKDVGTAYLIAKLKTDGSEDIYVELPPCRLRSRYSKVVILHKYLQNHLFSI
jgi:hypothetical protein